MNLGTRRHNLIQQPNDMIALRLRHTDNLGHEPWIEENALPASDGVCADQRVLGGDGVAAHGAAEIAGALGLELGGVEGCEGLEVLLHMGREHVVCCVLGGPEGVATAATGWAREDFEGCVGWGLDFVRYLWGVSFMYWGVVVKARRNVRLSAREM
jgi:hypothetical protein